MKREQLKSFYEKHKKVIWIGATVCAVGIGYLLYRKYASDVKLIPVQLKRNINKRLAGKCHPITGVPFVEKDIICENRIILKFVGPEFEGQKFDLGLTKVEAWEKLGGTEIKFYRGTMKLALAILREKLIKDPTLASQYGFSDEVVKDILKGCMPSGKTFHHCPETGKGGTLILQFVDKMVHNLTAHTGGSKTLNPNGFMYL
ncbi:HNH endonuclease [uncultured Bacteroides sp.]|uniref:HNH endonuclease n=1 Tax=uncultured Bacteroides sp. TaxID=162156 RepID=UPI002585D036|nr:HNH endonuclease [uncultured Bacteroides sp.]